MPKPVRTVLVFWTDNKLQARATLVNDVPRDAVDAEVAKRQLGIPCMGGPEDWNGGGTVMLRITADMVSHVAWDQDGNRVEFEQGRY